MAMASKLTGSTAAMAATVLAEGETKNQWQRFSNLTDTTSAH
jgi:hypothetical protein